MFCLFVEHKKQINLSLMDLISILTIWSSQIHYKNGYWLSRTLVITEVTSKFYWEKTLYKGNFLRGRAGPSRMDLNNNLPSCWFLSVIDKIWSRIEDFSLGLWFFGSFVGIPEDCLTMTIPTGRNDTKRKKENQAILTQW